ncbi:MAG TPA: lipocalin family protein [Lysobacter sp.]|nr:lipocalin family protein [Lysobacter sp.]
MLHATLLNLAIATGVATGANAPVSQLDLQRYLGTWHEIAHLPMFFQRQCVDKVSATYTQLPDGTIEVRNACRTNDGSIDESIGVARPVEGHPGQLKVRFAPDWLSWLPMVWADYWVIDLDPDYRWAVVGGPSHKYLWVLSRTPTMERALFERLKIRARERGYPVDKLVMAAPLE